MINCGPVSSLGFISHVFFDKTDTLTHSSQPPILTHLSTPQKLFNLDVDTVEEMFVNVKVDPSKYQKHDDLEELMKEKEDDNYSEKSQEFNKEVKGEYDPGIFDEFQESEIDDNSVFLGSIGDSQAQTIGGTFAQNNFNFVQPNSKNFQSITNALNQNKNIVSNRSIYSKNPGLVNSPKITN
jgi:hypothetical protein